MAALISGMRESEKHATHLERLPRLAFLTCLLQLRPPHLLFELTLAYAAVVLEREEDVERGQSLELRVVLVRVGRDNLAVCGPPTRRDVYAELLEQRDHLADAAAARGAAFLLLREREAGRKRGTRDTYSHAPSRAV